MTDPGTLNASRVSHERVVLDQIRASFAGAPDLVLTGGQGLANRFAVPAWELLPHQQSQFGDLRLEGTSCTVVVEVESAGGVTNLVKYWPYLAAGARRKRFVLVHLFRLISKQDYIAHRRLWTFLVERMQEDLERRCNVRWPQGWEARQFTYGTELDVSQPVAFIREALATAPAS